MLRLAVLLFSCLAINAQLLQEAHPAPEPYAFAYSAPNEDGSISAREETGDASGRVTGFYTLVGEGGQQRRVEYVADENGFRAVVQTNEIGTESKDAADAQYLSSAPTAAELVAQWEASGAGRARLEAQRIRGVGLIAPRPIIRAGINTAGLAVAGPAAAAIGLAPAGVAVAAPAAVAAPLPVPAPVAVAAPAAIAAPIGLTRVQAIRAQAVAQPLALPLGALRGGLIGAQAIRTRAVGGGLIGVAPIGGAVQTLRTATIGGLGGLGVAGVVPAGLQGLALNGAGVVPAGLQGLALNGAGANLLVVPGSGLSGLATGNSVVRLVSGGGRIIAPQVLGTELIKS